ncbi:MAG TPA: DUF4097 domain-containing protein [Pseudogracilibacillus sp.]|nr:DUF4097 domain-containing protein [Pseudogracilibacillus sp.]
MSQNERKRILQLVQEGKLSAQEALVLLEALDGNSSEQPTANQLDMNVPVVTEEKSEDHGRHQSTDEKNKDTNEKDDSFYTHFEQAGEKIFEFVTGAFQKIKEIELPLNQSYDITHTFEEDAESIEKIDIDLANGPVTIQTWDQPNVKVECQAKVYRVDNEIDAKKYFFDQTIFTKNADLFCFSTQSKFMRVDTKIFLPNKEYKKLVVHIFNGSLTIEQLNSQLFIMKTTNGKIDLSQLHAKKIDINSVNGQIKLIDSYADEDLEVETVNGAIHVTGLYKMIDLQAFNGNVQCEVPKVGTKRIDAKTVTGNVQIELPEAATIDGDIRSNLGNYKLEMDGIHVIREKKEVIQKQVLFKRTGSDENVLQLAADTKTGSILISQTTV